MKDESKEIKISEETKRGEGQCELDDDAIEQAAGGIPENPWDAKTTREWADDAWERIKQQCT